jgi:uncharacterized membrane protein
MEGPVSGGRPVTLEQVIEGVLTFALLLASGLFLLGLILPGHEGALRAGLLILLFTPVARVVLVTSGLLRAGDYLFGGLSAFVLVVLASSIWVAFRL